MSFDERHLSRVEGLAGALKVSDLINFLFYWKFFVYFEGLQSILGFETEKLEF